MALLKKKSGVFRIICCLLAFLLVQNNLEHVQAQDTPFLPPGHNYFVDLSIPYSLPVLRGMRVYPDKPFEFDFMVGSGDRHTIDQKETSLLIKYFLTCLTIPEEDLWVNLSPYESGRIIPDELALTDAGNTLLQQDKFLKQLASSLTYPESRLGKKFWEQVYKKAYERFGTTDLPVNTYNKVWIVPDKAIVYDMGNSALIGETHLKVMLEEDYLALSRHSKGVLRSFAKTQDDKTHFIASQITKEIILPELEKEINGGKNFAPVRQIFHSMILAAWFKRALKRNVLSNFYVNKKKISGIDGVDKNAKEKIYKEYLRIYKVGAYNYIREDVDPISQQAVPRKYFSGGLFFGDLDGAMRTLQVPDPAALAPLLDKVQMADKNDAVAHVDLVPVGGQKELARLLGSQAMMSDSVQLSKSSKSMLSKFFLAVALSIPIAAGGLAHAATITSNADGKTLRVQVDSPSDTFGGILRQANYKGPLWGPKGAVAQVGEAVKGQIPDTHWVYLGQTYNIPKPSALPRAPAQGVQQPIGQAPAPQVNQQPTPESTTAVPIPAALPVTANTPAPRTAQAIYTHDYFIQPTPVESQIMSRVGGVVSDLVAGKSVSINDPLVNVSDRPNAFNIEGLTSDIQVQQGLVNILEQAYSQGANNHLDLVEAKLKLLDLQQQLDDARAQEALHKLKAPYDLTIHDVMVSENESIKPGTAVLGYYTRDRLRFDIPIPSNVEYFENMVVTMQDINRTEIPVDKSAFWFNYELSSKLQSRYLSVIVTPQSPISERQSNQQLRLHVKFLAPNNSFKIPNFPGKGTTYTYFGPVNEYTKTAPAATSYQFKVNQGEWVKKGDLIAQGAIGPIQTQLDIKLTGIEAINIKLSHPFLADGIPISAKILAELAISKNKLIAEARELQEQIARLDVTADEDGVVVWSGKNGSNVFQEGDPLYRVLKDRVFMGSFGDVQYSIILPNAHAGDFVEVKTKYGPLLGEVTAVTDAHTTSIALGGLKSVKVTVYDPMHILHPSPLVPENRVRVTLLTEQEKKQAQALLLASHLNSPSTVSAGSTPPPPPGLLEGYATSLVMPDIAGQFNIPSAPPAYYPVQGPAWNFTQVNPLVDQNQYLFINELHKYWQSKIAEGLPRAKSLNITGSLFGNGNGQWSGMLGANALLDGFGAGVTPYGRLANVGTIVFGNFFGDFIHIVSGGIGKEEAVARAGTNSLNYTLQTARSQQRNNAHDALIELYGAQQKIQIQNALLRDLNEAQRKAGIAKASNLISKYDPLPIKLQGQIDQVNGDTTEFQRQERFWTNTLNFIINQNNQTIPADVPFGAGIFLPISDDQRSQYIAEAAGPNGKDPRLLKAQADVEIQNRSLILNHVNNLPTLNVGAIMTPPNVNISSLPYEPLGGSIDRVSTTTPGVNPMVSFSLPIINQKGKLQKKIIASQLDQAKANVEETRIDIKKEVNQAIDDANFYAREIASAQAELQTADEVWQTYAGSDPEVFVQYRYYDQRQKIAELAIKIVDLKVKYLRQIETLKKMGIEIKDKAMASTRREFLKYGSLFSLAVALGVGGSLEAQDERQGDPSNGLQKPDTCQPAGIYKRTL